MGDIIFEEERSVQHDKAGRLGGMIQTNRRKVANVRGTATSDHHDVQQRLLPYSRSTARVSRTVGSTTNHRIPPRGSVMPSRMTTIRSSLVLLPGDCAISDERMCVLADVNTEKIA